MSRRAVFVLIAAALVAMLATNLTTYHRAEAQEAGNVVLTVRNVTAGQPLTPAVVVVHDGGADLLPEMPKTSRGWRIWPSRDNLPHLQPRSGS